MYTTEAKVEQYLQINIDDSISAYVTDWINWVTDYIEKYTGTKFEASAQTYYYSTHSGQTELFIDDVVSITSVTLLDEDGAVDDTLTEDTDYWLYPLNLSPKNLIVLNPYGKYARFPYSGIKRVKVVGSFGVSSTVPPQIEMVATQMVGDIVRQSSGEAKGKKSESLGEYSVTFEDIGKFSIPYTQVLDLYRTPKV